jgi:hypothetical protein
MTRRRKLIAIVVAIAAVVTVGLGARGPASDDASGSVCDDDLREAFEVCERGRENGSCTSVPEHLGDACQAGCVMYFCREQVQCTDADPIWCAPCTDMYGALFWTNLDRAQDACKGKLGSPHRDIEPSTFHACYVAQVESRCPALSGRNWWSEFQAEMKK